MCCSVSPGIPVHFSNTILYAAEMLQDSGESVHVLGYQNTAQNQAGRPLPGSRFLTRIFGKRNAKTGNAMILPFPAIPQSMSKANVLDTKDSPDILQDMERAIRPPMPPTRMSQSLAGAPAQAKVQIFEAAGIYTVVLAQDPLDIPAALNQVPIEKRPALNPELFAAYAQWYPDWTIALCCFNNQKAELAHPMLWWYKPMFADRLFLPAVDGHRGEVPDLKSRVIVDHSLVVSSHRIKRGNPVYYRDRVSALDTYLARAVIGSRYTETMPNGDFVCNLADVREGLFKPLRIPPTQLAGNLLWS